VGEKPVENVRKMGKNHGKCEENGTVLAGKCLENGKISGKWDSFSGKIIILAGKCWKHVGQIQKSMILPHDSPSFNPPLPGHVFLVSSHLVAGLGGRIVL
jgi:hypothetical protein